MMIDAAAMKESTSLLIWGWSAMIATVLQIIAVIRYMNRDSDDWIGVTLFGAVAVLLATTSAVAFFRWAVRRYRHPHLRF